jgi:hypothetical protein
MYLSIYLSIHLSIYLSRSGSLTTNKFTTPTKRGTYYLITNFPKWFLNHQNLSPPPKKNWIFYSIPMRHQFSQRFPRRPTAWWRHLLSDFAPANPPTRWVNGRGNWRNWVLWCPLLLSYYQGVNTHRRMLIGNLTQLGKIIVLQRNHWTIAKCNKWPEGELEIPPHERPTEGLCNAGEHGMPL